MKWTTFFYVTIVALVLGQQVGYSYTAHQKPNIILIMADDLGYECIAANGGQSYQTPVLDKLAKTGIRFENCHTMPLCTPTRTQLMTGMYTVRNYIRFAHLDPQAKTFANFLRDAGYATCIAGKWQLGHDKNLPNRFGFDESYLWQLLRRPPRYANPGLEINGVEENYRKGEYGPELINDCALDYIERHKDKPFLLYYPMILVHNPFQPTPDSPGWDPKAKGEKVNQNNKHFSDMVTYMDKMVGRIVTKLDELELRENTLILFLGDNGTNNSIASRFQGKNYRGGKGLTTVSGTHVPLIANWPGHISPGVVNHDLISSTDFLPTLCEVAGAKIPAKSPRDGSSFLPQLLGEKGTPREWIYFWYPHRKRGAAGKREFVMSLNYKMYRNGRLFDLATDPFEKQDLSTAKLTGSTALAAEQLRKVLNRYSDARPKHLRTPKKNKSASP